MKNQKSKQEVVEPGDLVEARIPDCGIHKGPYVFFAGRVSNPKGCKEPWVFRSDEGYGSPLKFVKVVRKSKENVKA